jgi:hypothetical protein
VWENDFMIGHIADLSVWEDLFFRIYYEPWKVF